MISAAGIIRMNREAAADAAQAERYPLELTSQDLTAMGSGDLGVIRAIPNLGDYIPAGYTRLDLEKDRNLEGAPYVYGDRFFVDKGFGPSLDNSGGPAYSVNGFLRAAAEHLRPGDCLALCDEGQFQINVAVLTRTPGTPAQGIGECTDCGEAAPLGDDFCQGCQDYRDYQDQDAEGRQVG